MFLDKLQERFQELQGKADVRTVFGEEIELNGRRVIPVASVQYGFGMGGGSGPRQTEGEAPGGGGGGGGMRVEPVALIDITDGKLKVEPIVNVTRLATMAMLLAAWSVFWVSRTIRALAAKRRA
ncbi:MAG: hypothetical protein HYU43_03340 [Armatimonadetes bacterium]|nr:hypothetical protein [Armatimonadota bacterium]